MKFKTQYEIVDSNGRIIAIRKTDRGLSNWKAKNNVIFQNGCYWYKGRPVWIDFCQYPISKEEENN